MSAIYSEPAAAFAVLTILDTLGEFFEASGKESFSKEDVQAVLSLFASDPDIVDPAAVIAYRQEIEYLEARTAN